MLEDVSFTVSRDFPNTCENESQWLFSSIRAIEISDDKANFVDSEDVVLRRSSKSLKVHKKEEALEVLNSCSQISPNDSGDNNGSNSDTSSLIHQIGRDISISCIARCSRSDYGSISLLNRSFRSLTQSKELYKLRREMGIIEHWVYFSCSLCEWVAFDPIRLQWMHLPKMPLNGCFLYSDKESLAVGTELLVFGRDMSSQLVYKFSILTNSWSLGAMMTTPRCLFGSASRGEIAIVAGGCDPQGKILASAELYDSEAETWVSLPSMNKPRKKCSGVFMDGLFYVIGGLGIDSNLLTCGEVFDLEKGTWTVIPNMFPPRNEEPGSAASEAPPLVAIVNNELYAADYEKKEVRRYNKIANSWDVVGNLPERVVSMQGWGLAFRACGKQLIVIGGPKQQGGIEINSWAPVEGPQYWTVLGRKQSSGFVYNCAVMGC